MCWCKIESRNIVKSFSNAHSSIHLSILVVLRILWLEKTRNTVRVNILFLLLSVTFHLSAALTVICAWYTTLSTGALS